MFLYRVLDIGFIAFHTVFILFVLFGWIWNKTRIANLVAIVLTAFSWFILGIWYGFGYCPCTDWHWQVRSTLGHHDMPHSYIKFLVDGLTGLNADPELLETITVALFLAVFVTSVVVNVRGRKRR